VNGIVIKSTGSQYLVRMEDGKVQLCRIRGNLRLKGFEATNPLTVGDCVDVEWNEGDDAGAITRIHERKNYIIRKSIKLSKQVQILAANIDRAFVVATPVMPKTSLGFIDRFLATAEAYSIPAGIIWNKCDLYTEEVWDWLAEVTEVYESIGYTVLPVSAQKGIGIDELKSELKDKVNLFSGHSGVGKSSLINRLIPGMELKTGSISVQHKKGVHTTTFAEMHALPEGGYIIDTPGIREFGTIDFDKYEISHFFPDIFKIAKGCRFSNCLHDNESDCAVKNAVSAGMLYFSRYQSYMSILLGEDNYK
jgi:ribosome biogenesis GTPase